MADPPGKKQIAKKDASSANLADPPRRNWAAAMGPDAGRIAQAAFARAGFTDPALVLRWADIAGVEIARIAQPVRFAEGPSGGVLTLLAEPGAALFLGHESRALATRINAYLGRPAVARLKFIQGALHSRPRPNHPPKPGAAPLPGDPALGYRGPEGLGGALKSLARWRTVRQPP